MEKLMQYVWKHRLWRSEDMVTNTGKKVRVVDPGLLNTDAGPDFFNAKIEIDGHMWVGNVEMHYRATDWKRHHHDSDKAYDSVILHVVAKDDAPVRRTNGELIPQLVLEVSPQFNADYASLVGATIEVPCATKIKQVPHLTIVEWVEGLAFERLHGKVERIHQLLDEPTNDIDVNTLRALEEGLENFAGCAVVVSHDRWFLDRICTHILSFEGDSNVVFYEGSYSEYEEHKRAQLGDIQPKRVRYRKLIAD